MYVVLCNQHKKLPDTYVLSYYDHVPDVEFSMKQKGYKTLVYEIDGPLNIEDKNDSSGKRDFL